MNFQAVEQANGNLVTMFGILTQVGGVQYTPQQKAKSVCKIRDDNGVEHTVHIYQGKGQLPNPQQLNQRCQFNLSTFQGSYKNKPYTGYSGFWDSQTQVNQGQQAPQQPNAGQPAPQHPQNDYKAKERVSIERQTCFKAACEFSGRAGLASELIIKVAQAGHYFIETGNDINEIPKPDSTITNPNYSDNPDPPPDDGIPY